MKIHVFIGMLDGVINKVKTSMSEDEAIAAWEKFTGVIWNDYVKSNFDYEKFLGDKYEGSTIEESDISLEDQKNKLTLQVIITNEDIDDIMCTALEGGITYWCNRAEVVGDYLGEYGHEQISRGGIMKLHDSEENKVYELNTENLLKGIKTYLSKKHTLAEPWNQNILEGNKLNTGKVDALVADCIIQYALFDDIIYG